MSGTPASPTFVHADAAPDRLEVLDAKRCAERATGAAVRRRAIGRAQIFAIRRELRCEPLELDLACGGERAAAELFEECASGGGVTDLVEEHEVEHAADRRLGRRVAIRRQRVDRLSFDED